MHVGVAGPVDLLMLAPLLDTAPPRAGYAFPFTADLVTELVARGHRVSVFAEDEDATAPALYRGDALTVYVVPMRPRARDRALDLFRAERRLLTAAMRDAAPDVVHAHWTYEFALAAEASGLPTLVTVHDWAPAVLRLHRDPYRAVRLAMQARTLVRARHLTAVSPYIADRVGRTYRKRPVVVPNGLASFPAAKPRTDPVRRIGTLNAGFDRLKNVTTLLRAHASLSPGVTLHLAGPGFGPGGEAARWASANGLADGVVFEGPLARADVSRYLDGLDAFVHPSLEESFGMAVLEAMAHGLPVVGGARSGAVPWLLDDGRAGYLCDVGDASALAATIERVAADDERAEIGARARERAREQFSLVRVADAYEEQYGAVIG